MLLVILRGRVHELELGPVWAVAARSLIADRDRVRRGGRPQRRPRDHRGPGAGRPRPGGPDRHRRAPSGSRRTRSSPTSCASRSCPLSSGSWPTCSADRAERERSADEPPRRRHRDLGRVRLRRSSGFVPPALGVGPGQGRQRLVGGPAARRRRRGRPHRRPGPPPAAATAALGVRLRPARTRRGGLVAGRRRGCRGGLRGGVPVDAPGAGRSRVAPPDRPRARGGRSGRRGRRRAPALRGRRLAPGRRRSSRTRPGSSTSPPTRTRSGATSARSGGST